MPTFCIYVHVMSEFAEDLPPQPGEQTFRAQICENLKTYGHLGTRYKLLDYGLSTDCGTSSPAVRAPLSQRVRTRAPTLREIHARIALKHTEHYPTRPNPAPLTHSCPAKDSRRSRLRMVSAPRPLKKVVGSSSFASFAWAGVRAGWLRSAVCP